MGDDLTEVAQLAQRALQLASSDPAKAIELADRVRRASATNTDNTAALGVAEWAAGLALRHLGQHSRAVSALQLAVRHLTSAGDNETAAKAVVSLAWERATAGHFDYALDQLKLAEPLLDGPEAAVVTVQRALILQRAGRVVDALESWNVAVAVFRRAHREMDEAKALQNRGIVYAYRGDYGRAERDLRSAETLVAVHGDEIRLAELTHNRGFVAARSGNLPEGLRLLDQAQRRFGELGVVRPEMLVDRVEILLDAGLTKEACEFSEAAIGQLDGKGLLADLAEACLLACRAFLEHGDPPAAADWGRRAEGLFSSQRRPRWTLLAHYRVLRAETSGPDPIMSRQLARLTAMGPRLREAGWWTAAVDADVTAVALLVDKGRIDEAAEVTLRLRADRRRGPALTRMSVWFAEARLRRRTGDTSGARRALATGIRALGEHQATLGSAELHSRATHRADEAIDVAIGLAIDSGRPGSALRWIERIRSGAIVPRQAPNSDLELAATLETLRQLAARLANETIGPGEADALRRRQRALEELCRRRSLHTPGTATLQAPFTGVDAVVAGVRPRSFVLYGVSGGSLYAAVLAGGNYRLVDLGAVIDARRAIGGLRLGIQIAVAQLDGNQNRNELRSAAGATEELLLVPLGLPPGRDGLVIVPAGPAASMPWHALPGLAATAVTVAPSGATWLRGQRALRRVDIAARPLIVLGPDLLHGPDEVEAIATIYGPNATVLADTDASPAQVLRAAEGRSIMHIAAHGQFRDDNPLLSSIRLTGGPLTGYHLERIHRPPKVVVLSCCDAATTGDAGAGSFGLAGILMRAGVASIVAATTPIDDAAAAQLMPLFHRALVDGHLPASALAMAREQHRAFATELSVASLTCFGSG